MSARSQRRFGLSTRAHDMLNAVYRWIFRSSARFLGIDLGQSAVKIAEADLSGRVPLLQHWAIADATSNEVRALAELAKRTVRMQGMRARRAVILIGADDGYVQEVHFPALKRRELKEAVRWELEKRAPFGENSYYYDYRALGTAGDEAGLRVMLAAAPKVMIDGIVEAFADASFSIAAIEIEQFALGRFLPGKASCALLDIGKKGGKLTMYQEQIPVRVQPICAGGDAFTASAASALDLSFDEAESFKISRRREFSDAFPEKDAPPLEGFSSAVSALAQELLRASAGESSDGFREIVLCGGGARLSFLAEELSKRVGAPVSAISSLERFAISKSLDASQLEANFPQIAACVGASLRGGCLWSN